MTATLQATVMISVEEIAETTVLLSYGDGSPVRGRTSTHVATIEEVIRVEGIQGVDAARAGEILKQIKAISPPQYITELQPGRYRARVVVTYEVEPVPFDAAPGPALP